MSQLERMFKNVNIKILVLTSVTGLLVLFEYQFVGEFYSGSAYSLYSAVYRIQYIIANRIIVPTSRKSSFVELIPCQAQTSITTK